MLGLIIGVILGALEGFIASYLMGEKSGTLKNIILGLLGSFVGGLVFRLIGFSAAKFSIAGIIVSVVGACICIFIGRKLLK